MSRILSAVFAVVLLVGGTNAFAACNPTSGVSCLNKPCDKLGMTMMDGDQTSILACLRKTAGSSTLEWKSNIGSSGVTAKKSCPAQTINDPTSWTIIIPLTMVSGQDANAIFTSGDLWAPTTRSGVVHCEDGVITVVSISPKS